MFRNEKNNQSFSLVRLRSDCEYFFRSFLHALFVYKVDLNYLKWRGITLFIS